MLYGYAVPISERDLESLSSIAEKATQQCIEVESLDAHVLLKNHQSIKYMK